MSDEIKELRRACKIGNVAKVKNLIEAGVDPTSSDDHRQPPLYWALARGHTEVIKLFISAGFNFNFVHRTGWVPLHLVSLTRQTKIMKLLLEIDVDVNLPDNSGQTPLFAASHHGNAELAKLLLDAGADPSIAERDGWTPLHIASRLGNINTVKLLLAAGADFNCLDVIKRSPLYLASFGIYPTVVKLLLDAGANLGGHTGDSGWTCLHAASVKGCAKIMALLLQAGADPNTPSNHGQTPIFIARKFRHMRMMKLLLDFGADPDFVDKNGQTPHSQAFERQGSVYSDLLECWPRVVPLRTLCLRVIHVKTNNVTVPAWLPPVLLEWPTIEEVTGMSYELTIDSLKLLD